MKLLALVFTFSFSVSAFAARDAASQAAYNFVNDAMQVMQIKSDQERFEEACRLLKGRVQSNYIAGVWLGRYASTSADRAGVRAFTALIPSIMITKIVEAIGDDEVTGSVVVGQRSTAKGNGVFDVRVTASNGSKSYTGTAVLKQTGSVFRLMDGRYMGFSAVNYMKREYQDILDEKAQTTNRPVTAMVQHLKSQPGFLECP